MKSLITVFAAALLLMMTANSYADAILEVTTSSGTQQFADDDGDGLIYAMDVVNSDGDPMWEFVLNTMTLSHPDNQNWLLNIMYAMSNDAGDVSVTIYFSENDLPLSGDSTRFVVDSVEGSTSDSDNWWGLWVDSGNETLARTTSVFAPRSFDYTGSRSVDMSEFGDLYSLTMGVGLNLSAGDSGSIDYSLKVPEPGTLALLGLGLVGVGLSRRRRQAS